MTVKPSKRSAKDDAKDARDHPLPVSPVGSPSHDEALLDEALSESFPASDPISPSTRERDAPPPRRDVPPPKRDDDSSGAKDR